MTRNRIHSRALTALLLALATACTTTPNKPDGKGTDGAQGTAGAGEEQLTGRSMRLFDDAMAAYEEHKKLRVFDWQLLEQKFRAVIAADDRFAEAYYNLGVILERERKPEEAKKAYQDALKRKPSLKQAAENLAVIYQNEGRPADAVALYQDILRRYPEDGAARARMAALYRESGDPQRAMELAREALMREPQNLTAYKVLMRCYLDRNNLSMAKLVALRATEQLKASDPELSYTVGLIHERENNEQGAIAYYRKAVEERDDFLAARVRIADIAAKHQDWSSAADQYRKIIQYDSSNVDAHVNLGVAYKGLGEIDKAFAEYDTVLKADPNNALAHFDLGVLFHKHKDAPEKAIEHYKSFVALSRDVVPADHPVFESIRECEQYIRQMAEMKAAEERAKKEAEEQKRLEEQKKREEQDKAQAEEKAKQEAEQQRRQQEAKSVVDAAMGSGNQPAAQQPAAQQPPAEQAPNGTPPPAVQEASKPTEAAAPAPAPAAPQSPEPSTAEPASDEPQGEP